MDMENSIKMAYVPPNRRDGFSAPPRPSPFGSSRGRRQEEPHEKRRKERDLQQLIIQQEEERKETELRNAIATRDINHFPTLGGGGGVYDKQQPTNGSFAEKAKQWKEQREIIEAQQEDERIREEARLQRVSDRERADAILRSKLNACNRKTSIVNPLQEEAKVVSTDEEGWTTVKPKERKIKQFNYDEIPEEEPQKKKEEDEFPVYDAEYERY